MGSHLFSLLGPGTEVGPTFSLFSKDPSRCLAWLSRRV